MNNTSEPASSACQQSRQFIHCNFGKHSDTLCPRFRRSTGTQGLLPREICAPLLACQGVTLTGLVIYLHSSQIHAKFYWKCCKYALFSTSACLLISRRRFIATGDSSDRCSCSSRSWLLIFALSLLCGRLLLGLAHYKLHFEGAL